MRYIILILSLNAVLYVNAQSDTLSQQMWQYNKMQHGSAPHMGGYSQDWNAANSHFYPMSRYRHTRIDGSVDNRGKAALLHQGAQTNKVGFHHYGYRKMKNASVQGDFSYNKGLHYNTEWSDITDYNRVYPYVVADSSIGDTHFEQYQLGGTYTFQKMKNVFAFSGRYYAEGTYRKRDPRVKDNVSNLQAQFAYQRELKSSFIGVDFDLGRYRQKMSSGAKHPDRKDFYYFLTGLGNYNRAFSGVADGATGRYYGYHYGGSLQLMPKNDNSIWAASKILWTVTDFRHRSEEVLSRSIDRDWSAELGYQFDRKTFVQYVKLMGKWKHKTGDEYYYESIIVDPETKIMDNRLLSISEKFLGNYYHAKAELSMNAVNTSSNYINILLNTKYRYATELYRLPKADQSMMHLVTGIDAFWQRRFIRSQFSINMNAHYHQSLQSDINIDESLNPSNGLILPDYRILNTNYLKYGLSVGYDYLIKNIGISIQLSFGQIAIDGQTYSSGGASIGLKF